MFWVLRSVWRRRRQIPHGHLVLPALAVYAPLWLITGPVPALILVSAGAAWIVGAPRLENRYHDGGE